MCHPPKYVNPRIRLSAREPQATLRTDSEYAEKWQEMRHIAHRLVFAYLAGPIGFAINYYLFAGKSQQTLAFKIFVVAWLAFFAWTFIGTGVGHVLDVHSLGGKKVPGPNGEGSGTYSFATNAGTAACNCHDPKLSATLCAREVSA